MSYQFRPATTTDIPAIWQLLQQAIQRRKDDGSNQWQDGYPNPEVVTRDIENGNGYVLSQANHLIAYCAILSNDEPAYNDIEGKWLTTGDFVVFHRIAVSDAFLGKGVAKVMFDCIETVARKHNIYSIKADTNFNNAAMLALFHKMGYVYCGEVYFRGSPRKAFEKVLNQ